MDIQEDSLKEKEEIKNKSKISMEKDSIQYNSQDLDQEQNCEINPVQLNTQNVHVHVRNDQNSYSSKITGVTFIKSNKEIAANVSIQLFIGHEYRFPVYKTKSDDNGNFIIVDIPPGYYTLYACLGENLSWWSYLIKVLSCQNVNQSIVLK
jgi:hypothetical protein